MELRAKHGIQLKPILFETRRLRLLIFCHAGSMNSGGTSGTGARPFIAAWKYSPVPPTMIGTLPACRAVSISRATIVKPCGDRGPFGAIENAIEAMGGPCLFTVIGARRQHPKIAIKLHRVGIDDDAATALRKRERQPGFARGRRPADHQDGTVGEGVI